MRRLTTRWVLYTHFVSIFKDRLSLSCENSLDFSRADSLSAPTRAQTPEHRWDHKTMSCVFESDTRERARVKSFSSFFLHFFVRWKFAVKKSFPILITAFSFPRISAPFESIRSSSSTLRRDQRSCEKNKKYLNFFIFCCRHPHSPPFAVRPTFFSISHTKVIAETFHLLRARISRSSMRILSFDRCLTRDDREFSLKCNWKRTFCKWVDTFFCVSVHTQCITMLSS